MEVRLDGKRALITGGSAGLGRAAALRFAESGADVAILARSPDKLEDARAEIAGAGSGEVVAIPCDVSDAARLETAYAEAARALGGIDILLNNAGTSKAAAFETLSDADWYGDLDLKFMAAVRLCRLALPGMRERGWGRVINVLNIGAKAPRGGGAPTVVSRAAGLALTKVLANEYGPHGVLVNALMIGLIATEQWETRRRANAPEKTLAEYMAPQAAGVPLRRIGEPGEFANLACFLASDAASFINGVAINVDGGMSPVV